MSSKHRQEHPVPISPSLNLAPRGTKAQNAVGRQVPVVARINKNGQIVIKYGGVVLPDGPSHGTILVNTAGLIVSWVLPSKGRHWVEEEGLSLAPRMEGRWPDDIKELISVQD